MTPQLGSAKLGDDGHGGAGDTVKSAKLELHDAFPLEAIRKLVPETKVELIASSPQEWREAKPAQVPPACLFMWDEMVHRGRTKKPFKISPVVDRGCVGIYEFLQRELERAPVLSAYTVSAFGSDLEYSFADVSLVKCYPSDIHICDVEFSDMSRPVSTSDPTRRYRGFHGLHVFDEFLSRLVEVAKSQGVTRISLMVAHPPLYEVFKRHGFEVSATEASQRGFHLARMGFPMIKSV